MRQTIPFATSSPEQIAQIWGWDQPPKSVLAMAHHAHMAAIMKSADFLVHMDFVSAQEAQRLLANKPEGLQTITWFAQQDKSRVPLEHALALTNQYPFYQDMSELTLHPAMEEKDVIKAAERIDAVVMLIEGNTPVVVFSTFMSLVDFSGLGPEDCMNNAILRRINPSNTTPPKLAVATRDGVSAYLKAMRSDDSSGLLKVSNFWDAASAENKATAAHREITRILDHAIEKEASDIAIEPTETGRLIVRIRIGNDLQITPAIDKEIEPDLGEAIMNLLEAKSGANRNNTTQRLPSDGNISYRSSVGHVDLRASFIPTNRIGQIRNLRSSSIRLIKRTNRAITLQDLNVHQALIEEMDFIIRKPKGLVLVVGPTNSGKTTLMAALAALHALIYGTTRKRMIFEDPVERKMPDTVQYNVPDDITAGGEDKQFPVLLRAAKRHDPDLIGIGEIRDRQTAEIAVASSVTGHLVFSTLHGDDALMGLDILARTLPPELYFQLVESISIIISQRMVTRLCPACKQMRAPTDHEQTLFSRHIKNVGETASKLPKEVASPRPGGCNECGGTGTKGMVPLVEFLTFDRDVKNAAHLLLSGKGNRDALDRARPMTLLKHGMERILKAEIEVKEILV